MKPATRDLRADNDHLEVAPVYDREHLYEPRGTAIARPAWRIFEVRFDAAGWKVVTGSGELLSQPMASREGAVAEGLRQAAHNQPSRLIIRRANGSTQEERVFGQVAVWRRRRG